MTAVACGRVSSTGGASLANVYAGSVRVGDIAPILGDAAAWWPGPPQFGVRPLDSSTRPDYERFELLLRFVHNGTAESIGIQYRVMTSSSIASAIMSSLEQSFGTSLRGPSAGDQILYYNQNTMIGAAPYESLIFVRVAETQIVIRWSRSSQFASTNDGGALAKKVVAKLKQSISGKARASALPTPDPHLIPPEGPDLTMLGSDRLPVEVVAQMVGATAPDQVVTLFKHLGASQFVYADYALNADTHMEVLTSAFTFTSSTGAADWLDQFIGKANLDQTGSYFNYDDPSGQYIAAFGVGGQGVLMVCRSAAVGQFEAASRACESPMARVAGAWKQVLGG